MSTEINRTSRNGRYGARSYNFISHENKEEILQFTHMDWPHCCGSKIVSVQKINKKQRKTALRLFKKAMDEELKISCLVAFNKSDEEAEFLIEAGFEKQNDKLFTYNKHADHSPIPYDVDEDDDDDW